MSHPQKVANDLKIRLSASVHLCQAVRTLIDMLMEIQEQSGVMAARKEAKLNAAKEFLAKAEVCCGVEKI